MLLLQGARATAEAQQLPHEVLTAQQAMQRFPGETLLPPPPGRPPSPAVAGPRQPFSNNMTPGLVSQAGDIAGITGWLNQAGSAKMVTSTMISIPPNAYSSSSLALPPPPPAPTVPKPPCPCRPSSGLQLPPTMPVLFEAQGGILEPEKMVAAHVKVAQYHGAQVHTGTTYSTGIHRSTSGHCAGDW